MLAQAALVVDPRIDDDVRSTVITEEEPETAKELRPEPMPIFHTERVALSIFRAARIGRDHLQYQLCESCEDLHIGVEAEVLRIGLACPLTGVC
jgi:hypothetical protein